MPIKGMTMPTETREKIKATKQAHPYIYTEDVKARMQEKAARPRPWLIKGQKVRDGYILMYQPNHPRADLYGYVRRADLIMERMLGRLLAEKEIVSHKNLVRDDDRPENLQLFPDRAEHSRSHGLSGDYGKMPIGKGNIANLTPFKKGYDLRRNEIPLPKKANPLEARRLYLDEELSLTVTARKLGVSISTIRGYLDDLGVATRSVSEAMRVLRR